MHAEAFAGFGTAVLKSHLDTTKPLRVLDFGGQDVNTTGQGFDLYGLLGEPVVTTLDLHRADIIADAATWEPDQQFDVVMATELFEHIPTWREVIRVMHRALDPHGEGVLLVTCASKGRGSHGMSGDPYPARGEWYGNVDVEDLLAELFQYFDIAYADYQYPPGDAYAWARL